MFRQLWQVHVVLRRTSASRREDDRGPKASVMKPEELPQVRGGLIAFAGEMFASLPRSDQRRWGEIYLRGLMTDGRRKSI
jgi:hypothetical protein